MVKVQHCLPSVISAIPKAKAEKERDPLLFEARALSVFYIIEIQYRNMDWRKVKIRNIVVLLRENFYNFSFNICCVIGQGFQNREVSRFAITIISNVSKRAHNLGQTVLLHPPPLYQHQAREGTLRLVIAGYMLQSSKLLAYSVQSSPNSHEEGTTRLALCPRGLPHPFQCTSSACLDCHA